MPHSKLSDQELLNAIDRVCQRLLKNGWIAKIGEGHEQLALEYTERGLERMNLLREILFEEIHPRLTSEDYIGLLGVLSMRSLDDDRRPSSPESYTPPPDRK